MSHGGHQTLGSTPKELVQLTRALKRRIKSKREELKNLVLEHDKVCQKLQKNFTKEQIEEGIKEADKALGEDIK